MATIISVHSFRGGTGKSNTTANIAAVLATRGLRVGVIDGDIQSPGIHTLFGLGSDDVHTTLNDFLWHGKQIRDVAIDVTDRQQAQLSGRIFLIASSMQPSEITRVLREGYDARQLSEGIRALVGELALDVLVLDTHPGLNEETLLSLVISDALLIIMRPDRQDYEGTGITTRVAKELQVPHIQILINKAPAALDHDQIARQAEAAYDAPVVAVLPHSDELMMLASEGIFVLRHPDHPLSAIYRKVADSLLQAA
jgi:septum site-determining protein MinD